MEHIRSDAIGQSVHIDLLAMRESHNIRFDFFASGYELLSSFIFLELRIRAIFTFKK